MHVYKLLIFIQTKSWHNSCFHMTVVTSICGAEKPMLTQCFKNTSNKSLRNAFLIVILTCGANIAHAVPIFVDPASTGSTVDISLSNQNCAVWAPCWADWAFSTGANSLDGSSGAGDLEIGDSLDVDFFDLSVGGFGSADATIIATLAFDSPDVLPVATGQGNFWTFFGLYSEGTLVWEQPGLVDLNDGSYLSIKFDNIDAAGFGNGATVGVTIAHVSGLGGGPTGVPEPGTLALIGIGLLALGITRRRQRATVKAKQPTQLLQ